MIEADPPPLLDSDLLEETPFDDVTQHDTTDDFPEPLPGFDEERSERPVVLLESPKPKRKGHDFVDDLGRRLDSDED
ncbi:MAG: hypothetical protein JRH11_09000 [Deltaproteobacteria bacterium]|nr:hypothetical protein [Deltaproteobacteria bacterium]